MKVRMILRDPYNKYAYVRTKYRIYYLSYTARSQPVSGWGRGIWRSHDGKTWY